MLAQLAQVQLEQKKNLEAAQTAGAAVDLAYKNRLDAWPALDRLAAVQIAQGNTHGALETLVSMDLAEKGRDKPDQHRLLHTSRQRGHVLISCGRSGEALRAFEQSIDLTEQIYGPQHPETANFLVDLGALCRETGCHPQAQQHLQRAIKIYRADPEYDAGQTSKTLRELALSLEESGNLEGATAEYERLVSFCERQVGTNGKDLLSAQVLLSALYVQTGRGSAARELLGPAIATLERNKGALLKDALLIMAVAEDLDGRPKEAAVCRAKVARLTPVRATQQ
jgi:tetratricopeptide (TPR) repeat protein